MVGWKMKQRNFIGRVVSQLRNQLGLTQVDLAAELHLVGWQGASRDTVAKLEGGSLRVDLIQICYLAAALGVPPARILSAIDWSKQIKKLLSFPLKNHNQ
jgi:transcriptional regulator with XRE-family HTH domain